jgi:hypothetical protein
MLRSLMLDPSTLGPETAVLVKGSRVAGLEVLAAHLIGETIGDSVARPQR